jgi:hypothetical protein
MIQMTVPSPRTDLMKGSVETPNSLEPTDISSKHRAVHNDMPRGFLKRRAAYHSAAQWLCMFLKMVFML